MSSGSSSKRRLRTSRAAQDGRGVAGPDAVEACHQLPGEALTDAEPFLDRLAVEMVCVDLAERLEDFIKSMKPGGLGGHGGKLLFYYTLGSDPALWPAGERREGGLIMHDKGYYHSYL